METLLVIPLLLMSGRLSLCFEVPPEVSEISAPDDCRESVGRVIAEPDGTDALLRLEIVADPCPSVTWMVNGTEIDFVNNTLQIPNDPCSEGDVGVFNFTLNITDVTEGFGDYIAFIENRAGNLTTEVVLVTPEVPAEVVEISFSSDPPCLLENSLARIRCETRGYPQPVITFFKGASEITFDDRIMLLTCDEIVINSVEQTDEGLYSCSATNPANLVPARPPDDAQLDYCTEPVIISLTASDPQPTEGDDITLDCKVAGTPPPDVEWRVTPEGTTDSVPVVLSNRILETTVDDNTVRRLLINDVATEDSGVYLCIAFNTAGEDEKDQLIEVRAEPVIISLTASDSEPTEGDDITLDCKVAGTPPPGVEWQVIPEGTTDPIDVVFSNRVLQTTVNDTGLVYRLQINDIETEDSGVYLCIASNTAGEDEQDQLIEVKESSAARVISAAGVVIIAVLMTMILY